MKNYIKAFLFAIVVVLGSGVASAQSYGGGISYGLDFERLAIHARADLNITDKIHIVPNVNYWLIEGFTFLGINGDVHYDVLEFGDGGTIYPLVGLRFDYVHFSNGITSGSNTDLGLNIGGGASLPVGGMKGFGELFYQRGDGGGQIVITLGVLLGGE